MRRQLIWVVCLGALVMCSCASAHLRVHAAPAPDDIGTYLVGLGVPDDTEICIEQWIGPTRFACVSVGELRRGVLVHLHAN